MCLLSVIDAEPSYGYELVRKLQDQGLSLASEGSIYPLLSRLQKNDFLEGYLVQSSEGPARKYYRVTDAGHAERRRAETDWRSLAATVDRALGAAGVDPTETRSPTEVAQP